MSTLRTNLIPEIIPCANQKLWGVIGKQTATNLPYNVSMHSPFKDLLIYAESFSEAKRIAKLVGGDFAGEIKRSE